MSTCARTTGDNEATGFAAMLDATVGVSRSSVDAREGAVDGCVVDTASGLLSTTRDLRGRGRGVCAFLGVPLLLPVLLAETAAVKALALAQLANNSAFGFCSGSHVGAYCSPVAGSILFHLMRYCILRPTRRSCNIASACQSWSSSSSVVSAYLGFLVVVARVVGLRFRFGVAITRGESKI